jgi:hypothetical protein
MMKLAAPVALALASVALVACGGSSNTTTTTEGGEAGGAAAEGGEKPGGGGSTVELEADPNGGLAYTTTEATATAGSKTKTAKRSAKRN